METIINQLHILIYLWSSHRFFVLSYYTQPLPSLSP